MDAALMPTADAIKTNHCGETDDNMLLKDCMVGKAQIQELREQNISQHRRTDRLRESCARRLGMYNKAYKIRVIFIFLLLVIVLLVSWLAVEPSERLVCTLVHGWTRSERRSLCRNG
jgi:hypothetical protein